MKSILRCCLEVPNLATSGTYSSDTTQMALRLNLNDPLQLNTLHWSISLQMITMNTVCLLLFLNS